MDEMIAVHLRGTFLVTRLVLPGMLEQGDGRIINVSSQLGQIGREWFTHYAAAKAGIIGFTRSLAREVSARGVLVNCIAPGPINTGIVPNTDGAPRHDYISSLPLPRVGEPDEVAPAAAPRVGGGELLHRSDAWTERRRGDVVRSSQWLHGKGRLPPQLGAG